MGHNSCMCRETFHVGHACAAVCCRYGPRPNVVAAVAAYAALAQEYGLTATALALRSARHIISRVVPAMFGMCTRGWSVCCICSCMKDRLVLIESGVLPAFHQGWVCQPRQARREPVTCGTSGCPFATSRTVPAASMMVRVRTVIKLALPREPDASCNACASLAPWLCCRFVLGHPLVASAVVGASTLQQLQELLQAAAQGPMQDEQLLADTDSIHQRYPSPTP